MSCRDLRPRLSYPGPALAGNWLDTIDVWVARCSTASLSAPGGPPGLLLCGRFLSVLPDEDRDRLAAVLAEVPLPALIAPQHKPPYINVHQLAPTSVAYLARERLSTADRGMVDIGDLRPGRWRPGRQLSPSQ